MIAALENIQFDDKGLVPVITQEHDTGDILMFAFMNKEALELTVTTGRAVYFSRSRNKLWHKGEESGNVQIVKELMADCDKDVVLLKVEQLGGISCHTGRKSCFFNTLVDMDWNINQEVLKDPKEMYENPKE